MCCGRGESPPTPAPAFRAEKRRIGITKNNLVNLLG